jgi:hypothetical protein
VIHDSCVRELVPVLVSEWLRHLALVVRVCRVARANEAAGSGASRRSTLSVGAREGAVDGAALTRRRGSRRAGMSPGGALQLRLSCFAVRNASSFVLQQLGFAPWSAVYRGVAVGTGGEPETRRWLQLARRRAVGFCAIACFLCRYA